MDRLAYRQKARKLYYVALPGNHVSFVNQGYQVKGAKLRSLCTRLYFATKDGVGFSGQLLCFTKRNPRNGRSKGGAPLVPLTSPHPPPSQKKATLNSQDFRTSGLTAFDLQLIQ